jgi:hypothetical protein
MAAAARDEDFEIALGGRTQLQFAPDTARVRRRGASRERGRTRLPSRRSRGDARRSAAAIEAAAPGVSITVDESTILPFLEEFDGAPLDAAVGPISWTPLAEGVRQTIDRLKGWDG